MSGQKTVPVNNVLILADNRELRSNVIRALREFDAIVRPTQLKVGDFILSERVGVERKTIADFLGSVFNQRIFKQLQGLKESYQRPVLIIEGNPEALFMERDVNPNAIRGALASIAVDMQVPIIWTLNSSETAAQLFRIAYREQVLERRGLQIRAKTKAPSLSAQQEFLIAGLPGVSNVMARRLLGKFRTPEKVFRAKKERLLKIDKIGECRARKLRKILESDYQPDKPL